MWDLKTRVQSFNREHRAWPRPEPDARVMDAAKAPLTLGGTNPHDGVGWQPRCFGVSVPPPRTRVCEWEVV